MPSCHHFYQICNFQVAKGLFSLVLHSICLSLSLCHLCFTGLLRWGWKYGQSAQSRQEDGAVPGPWAGVLGFCTTGCDLFCYFASMLFYVNKYYTIDNGGVCVMLLECIFHHIIPANKIQIGVNTGSLSFCIFFSLSHKYGLFWEIWLSCTRMLILLCHFIILYIQFVCRASVFF